MLIFESINGTPLHIQCDYIQIYMSMNLQSPWRAEVEERSHMQDENDVSSVCLLSYSPLANINEDKDPRYAIMLLPLSTSV